MFNTLQDMVDNQEPEELFVRTPYSDVKNDYRTTSFGYWILPGGDVVSLLQSMSHGQVALKIEPKIDDMYDATHDEEDGPLDPVAAQIIAQNDLNWLRLSLNHGITLDWGAAVTKEQIHALEIVIDDLGAEDNPEIWYIGGPGDKAKLMKELHTVERESRERRKSKT